MNLRPNQNELFIRATRGWIGPGASESPQLNLSPAEQAEIARHSEVVAFHTKGSPIFHQGGRSDYLYLLLEGVVMSYHHILNGERQILAFHWPGDVFGLCENNLYVNSARAVTPCVARRFARTELEALLSSHPGLQDAFLVKAVHDLRNMQRQFVVMGKLDIAGRLAAFLLDCAGHPQYFDEARRRLDLPLSRADIADYLGTTPESVTRAFNRLESGGVLKRKGPRSLSLDRQKLRDRIAGV